MLKKCLKQKRKEKMEGGRAGGKEEKLERDKEEGGKDGKKSQGF